MEINAIYEGDNLEVMSKFNSKSIDLIYAVIVYLKAQAHYFSIVIITLQHILEYC
jgi:DNA modification methylase